MSTGQEVESSRVFYGSNRTLNLLLLLWLKETKMRYHDGDDYMILKRGDKEDAQAKQSWHLFILDSIIRSVLVMLASVYGRPTYLKASTDIRQLWYRRFQYTSYIHIKHLTKMVDRVQLDSAHPHKNDNILDNNQSDGILFDSLSE